MWSVHDLVPHGGIMLFLDNVENDGPDWLETGVRISEDSVFFEPGFGVPAWVGLEYMAQTVAAYIGLAARKAGEEPRVGFLLGTRGYNSHVPCFALGEKLVIRVTEEWKDNQMGFFNSHIKSDSVQSSDILAQARLSVFQPVSMKSFLEEHVK